MTSRRHRSSRKPGRDRQLRQRGDIVHQSVQFKGGTHRFAHIGNQDQLIRVTPQITVQFCPIHGARDDYRATLRHAVSRVRDGERRGLELPLDDPRSVPG